MFNVEATFDGLCVCDLVSLTPLFDGFSWSLVLELFKQICIAWVNFMKIGSVTFIFYLSECINFCLYFPHFLTDLGEIRRRISLIVELRYYGLYECRWSEIIGVYYLGVKVFNILPSYIKIESDNPKKFKLILQKLFSENSFYSWDEYFELQKVKLICIIFGSLAHKIDIHLCFFFLELQLCILDLVLYITWLHECTDLYLLCRHVLIMFFPVCTVSF